MIVPIVMYHGATPWSAPRLFDALLDVPASVRPAVAPYLVQAGGRGRAGCWNGGEVVDEKQTRFRCVIYDDRPRTCRELTLGSEHCLTARRRVGLSL